MQAFILLLTLIDLARGSPLDVRQDARGSCNQDNCHRAVGAAGKPTTKLQDCSSFLSFTVTPATSTQLITKDTVSTEIVTVTSTVYHTITGSKPAETGSSGIALAKRENAPVTTGAVTKSPTAIPTYASLCSGAVRYSSACSCFGVTAATTTVATPVTTVYTTRVTKEISTATVSVTSTIVVSPPASPSHTLCDQIFESQGNCRSNWRVQCGIKYTANTDSDIMFRNTTITEQQCIDLCDNYWKCWAVDYSFSNNSCTGYNRPGLSTIQDPDYDIASYVNNRGHTDKCIF